MKRIEIRIYDENDENNIKQSFWERQATDLNKIVVGAEQLAFYKVERFASSLSTFCNYIFDKIESYKNRICKKRNVE